jgi:hypothetical protein
MIPAGSSGGDIEVLERPCGIQHLEAGNSQSRSVPFGGEDRAEASAYAGRAGAAGA